MALQLHPLTPSRWPDLEAVFGARGCSVARGCWCMYYRHSGKPPAPAPGATAALRNRDALMALARRDPPPGLIGYEGAIPVGWVSLGPREDYAKLEKSPLMRRIDAQPVWAIVCFVVPSAYRGRGVAQALLDGATAYAAQRGVRLLEAYPVDTAATPGAESLWFGTRSMYERAGFVEVACRRPGRPVMRLELTPPPEAPTLFASAHHSVRELQRGEVPALQALFDANPEYFMAVSGRRANPDAAQVEFDEVPPAHLPYSRRWFCGIFGGDDRLDGAAIVISDLSAPGVWHLALFLLATRLHGSGAAAQVYAALQSWVERSGARWLRLGVVQGNTRAERFWQSRGFRELRLRTDVATGGRINTIRVLVKPLVDAPLDEYFRLVPRDLPGSTLP